MRSLRLYLLLSLLVHLAVFLLLQVTWDFSDAGRTAQTIWVDLKKDKYEVVDIRPPNREERPEAAQFLGRYDSKTEQERVAVTPWEERTTEKGRTTDHEPRTTDYGPRTTDYGPRSTVPALVPEDYYPNFHRGKHTYLNVLAFPDIQYFVRLKRVFKLTFDPLNPLREAYFQNRITRGKVEAVLGVSINKAGELSELFVLRESGVETYDQEALRTIRASAPFSAPPDKLLDSEGLLRMSWTFTVYL